MTPATKRVIIAALRNHRGDNLERALVAFKHYTPAQMQEQHGFSGQTRQAILDAYRAHVDAVETAMADVAEL